MSGGVRAGALNDVTLAGSRPGGRPSSLLRQRRRQERRPGQTGRRRCRRLPCAARSRRPSRNSPAAPAQTAAPDFPARRCAARRYGTGFAWRPSPCGTCWCYPCTQRQAAGGCRFRRGSVLPESPSEPPSSAGESAAGRPVKPGRLLCLLSWRSKKVGRPPGRDPANVTSINGITSFNGIT